MNVESLKNLAQKMLDKFGTEQVLIQPNFGVFNFELGKSETVKNRTDIRLAELSTSKFKFDNNYNIDSTQKLLIVQSQELIKKDDKIEINGVEFGIESLDEIIFKTETIIYKILTKKVV